jgi:hypothetical protein
MRGAEMIGLQLKDLAVELPGFREPAGAMQGDGRLERLRRTDRTPAGGGIRHVHDRPPDPAMFN